MDRWRSRFPSSGTMMCESYCSGRVMELALTRAGFPRCCSFP
jgi:hypothetical protein